MHKRVHGTILGGKTLGERHRTHHEFKKKKFYNFIAILGLNRKKLAIDITCEFFEKPLCTQWLSKYASTKQAANEINKLLPFNMNDSRQIPIF